MRISTARPGTGCWLAFCGKITVSSQVGHWGTTTTETVYRKVIVPELRRGAEVMDRLFI